MPRYQVRVLLPWDYELYAENEDDAYREAKRRASEDMEDCDPADPSSFREGNIIKVTQ